jgi:phosphatidylserine decarboxylase
MSTDLELASGGDRAFAFLQQRLPLHALSRAMHRLARSRSRRLRNAFVGTVLKAYPQIDMSEAAQPDPYAYESFNAFFTRALRSGARPIAGGAGEIACPVDGTVSQLGAIDSGSLVQAKGMSYTSEALFADSNAASRYAGGSFACLYLAPYNYHRIHMPVDGRLLSTRYVPGALFSVNAATARTIPGLFARNERVVCEFETELGPMALVLVGALFVGSIETVFAGEINPPDRRRGTVQDVVSGIGMSFARGEEIGRFNMGSTVVALFGRRVRFVETLGTGTAVRLGQVLARAG